MMTKQKAIIWAPAVLGIILLVVTKIDLYQFQNQDIDARTMLSREAPIFFIGLLLSTGVFLSSIYWFIKKQWFIAAQAIVSPLLFMVCFAITGVIGGTLIYAT